MKTILTPVDFSTASGHVLDAATELARAIDAEIVLLHVVQPPMVTSDYGLAMENVQEILAVSEKTGQRQLDHLTSRLAGDGLRVRSVQVNGAPGPAIVDQARDTAATYIVMGSHGHTALYELLVGSTTHHVLKKAGCPVVIVPPAPKK
jgi:nucleotide-binding universal stress UspA family protein